MFSQQIRVVFLFGLIAAVAGVAHAADKAQSKLLNADLISYKPIPHSVVSHAGGSGIVSAMLSCATNRYAHAVLGDAIEAACLIVEDESGAVVQLDLLESQVFEDLIPRIADINADGRNDVVLVRSDARQGAALTIYTLEQAGSSKALVELAATPPIGTAYRWLSPIGVADFNNDGVIDIAYVQTPHIGGILRVWSIIDGDFTEIHRSAGYSNHRIGDTRVSTSIIHDVNDDGVMDIALPDQHRRNTVWLSLYPEFTKLKSIEYNLKDFD